MTFINELTTSIEMLEKQTYPWSDSSKLDQIKTLIQQNSAGMRNRKSSLHLSASAIVFKNDQAIFIRHPYLHTILLPAGHVDPGELPIECAIREFHEETGGTVIQNTGKLIDVNIIDIPANPLKNEGKHQHIDFRYTFKQADIQADNAELPVFLLMKTSSPTEFQPYFDLLSV